ncbi:hypothetical protein HanHA300_Chr14g0522551 [Helianthus annuus]|nr:hypothetical protein HanHA300_Chr14g0522551 [Helianthus annuus]KAJ0485585.1 hypothetical protein HanHA89_Chr14g0569971 [Helianthus annuus]KAJ0656137.1 hypothetical protein HanLR1_Chr14g0532361 [Helianthus annuus]
MEPKCKMQGPKCKIQGPKWKMQGPKWKMQDQKNPHTAAIILAPPLFFSSIPPTVLVFPTLYRRHERAKRPTTHYLKSLHILGIFIRFTKMENPLCNGTCFRFSEMKNLWITW